jgi:serine phosphatase RsbU (regulator of sigma subunit)
MFNKSSYRIFAVVYGGLIILSAYLIFHNYTSQVDQAESNVLRRLHGIANNISKQIDQRALEDLYARYPLEGDTAGVSQDSILKAAVQILRQTKEANDLKTPIYTLTLDPEANHFVMGITSDGTSSYGWQYKTPPAELHDVYWEGGMIPQFTDDHGIWLSAVCPVRSSNGKVYSVIEVDYPFTEFMAEARKGLMNSILISLVVMIIIGGAIYPLLKNVLDSEEKAKEELEHSLAKISHSINYAQRIQDAIVANTDDLKKDFPNSFVLYRPRDVVSGDFPWYVVKDGYAYFAAVDCTGHGVPGAFMSLVGYFLLNKIVNEKGISDTGLILDELHKEIIIVLNQETDAEVQDGMDMSICRVDPKNMEIQFSGAANPMYHLQGEDLTEYRADIYSIGGVGYKKRKDYKTKMFNYKTGDVIAMFSDGITDQFSEAGKKFGYKPIKRHLLKNHAGPLDKLEEEFSQEMKDFMGKEPQLDDMLFLGIRL